MKVFVLTAVLMLISGYLLGLFKNGFFGSLAFVEGIVGGGGWKGAFVRFKDKLFAAFTAEEQKVLDDLKAEKEKLAAELESAKKLIPKQPDLPGANPPNPAPNDSDKISLEEQAKKNAAEKERIEKARKVIEDAVRFDYDIKNKITENLAIVGEEVKTILDLAAGRAYSDSVEKANELRASILNSFFSKQEHIDALVTETFKTKATDFLKLTQLKRNELSGQYWELFDLAVENIKAKKKQEELQKVQSGKNSDKDIEEYNKKFFAARGHYIQEKKAA
ncbi:MAG: hypothetical protein LBV16_09325 [Elusimicrobiota bacterium]|nr:hypothetical protein [Elusimicrobiota bacterium]